MKNIEPSSQIITQFKNVPFSIEFCEKTDFYTCQATIGDIEMVIQVDVSDKDVYIVTGCIDIGKDGYELPLCEYSRGLYDVTDEKGLKNLIDTFLDHTSSNTDKIYKIIEPN